MFAVMMAASVAIVTLTGRHTIDIDGTPTRTEWFVLAVFLFGLPVAGVVGWLVTRLPLVSRSFISTASLVIAILGGLFGGPSPRVLVDLIVESVIIAAILLCTATGLGSILGWAVRMAVGQYSR